MRVRESPNDRRFRGQMEVLILIPGLNRLRNDRRELGVMNYFLEGILG
jgi:hypothetical protein